MVYLISLIVFLLVAPAVSIAIDAALHPPLTLSFFWTLVGKWAVFWMCGVRLFLAGIKQSLQPQFTAETIFNLRDPAVHPLVREIGFGNLSMGALALASLAVPIWTVPGAIVGALYYGLAGLGHVFRGERNRHEMIAMVTDLLVFALLAAYLYSRI
jgi:hypothetical protein